jgi:hypothetical protein
MKKLVLTVAVLAVAGIVSAQVYSSNIVGYAKVNNQAGLQLFGMQFVGDSTATPVSVFGDSLPVGSKIYTYTNNGDGTGTYGITSYLQPAFPPGAPAAWNNPTLPLGLGSGFWVELPGAAADVETIMAGEVLGDASVAETIQPGLQLIANPYPYDITVGSLMIAPTVGDKVYTYVNNGDGTGTYGITSYLQPAFPPGAPAAWNNPSAPITVSDGFWYESAAGGNNTLTWDAP